MLRKVLEGTCVCLALQSDMVDEPRADAVHKLKSHVVYYREFVLLVAANKSI